MKAFCATSDREQFSTLLHFLGDTPVEVGGRMPGDIAGDLDDCLRAFASGELSLEDRNCLLEKLVERPELMLRLAGYLQVEPSPEKKC